ncbi:Uncharacterized protein OBRU01_18097, partial [Operophtera brumata]
MIANRVSYWIDGKGPSYSLDYACASSMACLEMAYQRLKAGDCDTALVGGCIHSMNPVLTLNMKRIYTEVYHVKGKYFSKPDATFLPTRISEADGNELDAVGRFFGKEKPIKVGSIKSNMGHTQPVSGACSLTKICLAYQRGEIPANLHFNEPQNHITAVKEGKVKVVKENTPFNRSFTAVNNFSITGANFHVLLKGHFKPKVCKRSIKYEINILHKNNLAFEQDKGTWVTMGSELMRIPIFSAAIESFVGITAVQIGLTDVLKSMDLLPDKIIGKLYLNLKVRDLCPPEIDIACRNSSESTTISGPKEDIEKFVAYLTSRSIFAKTVASNNIAFHSRYIADAGPTLLAKMKEVLKDPKTRSKKWLSTCFLPENWTNARCKHASPEYFTHNILNTVYFEETAKFIPDDAIVIEIAPHGLMQAIIKRSHVNCINVPLTRRNEKDNYQPRLQFSLISSNGNIVTYGINVFPESAILVIVWETVAMFKNTDYKNLSIVFNNVKFQDQIKIESEKRLKLQVTHDKTLIASGSIDFELKNNKRNYTKILLNDSEHHLNATDIYKVLSSRGYSYEGEFQSMQATNIERNKALLKWDRNWITFLDSLIQFNAISKDYDGVSSIKHINKLLINLKEHENLETVFKYNTICYSAQIFKDIKVSKCGGVTLKNIAFTDIPKPELTASRVQIKEKLGKLYIPVNVKTKTQNLKLNNDTYTWVENMDFSLNNAIQIIFTRASTSDFNLEKNPNINKYGTDFSGIDARGNRVMGFTSNSSISSFVEASPEFLWPVPQHWSLEEAATVPLPYIHALYCLAATGCVGLQSTYLDINEYGMEDNEDFGMEFLKEARSYKAICFTDIFLKDNSRERKRNLAATFTQQLIKLQVLQRMLSDGITRSIVKPLTCVVYSPTEISRAFKLLSTKNQRGRVLVNMKHPEMLNGFNALPSLEQLHAVICLGHLS